MNIPTLKRFGSSILLLLAFVTASAFGEVAETRYSSDGGETWDEGTLTEAVTAANKKADTIIELNKNVNFPVGSQLTFERANQKVLLRSNRSVNQTARYTITRTAGVTGSTQANLKLNANSVSLTIENVLIDLNGTAGNVIATMGSKAGDNSSVVLGEGVEIFNAKMGGTVFIQLIAASSSLTLDGAVIHDVTGASAILYASSSGAGSSIIINAGGIRNCDASYSSGNKAIVYVYSSKGTFKMTGGFIKDNTASEYVVKTTSSTVVDISGGEISGNALSSSKYGAIVLQKEANFSGCPVIRNNKASGTEKNVVYNFSADTKYIKQTGDLTEGAYIGVSNGSKEGDSFGSLTTAGLTGAEHFHCDSADLVGSAAGTALKWATCTDVTVAFSGTLTMDDWFVDEPPSEPSGLEVNYGTLTYKYYSDQACTQPLAERPSEVGVYYVRGEVGEGVDADKNRWAHSASGAVSFTIKSGDKEVVQTTVEGALVIEDWYRDVTPSEPTGLTLTSGHGELVYKYYAESACETELAVVPNVIGTYYVRGEVAADEDDHYIWTAWNSSPVAFQVLRPRYVITEPTVNTGLIYNGEEQTGVGPESDYYTLDDAVKTAAGEYMAIATLKTEGQEHELEWLDGTKEPKEFPWSIAKAQAVLTGKVTIQDWMQGDAPAPSGVTASFGEVQYRYYLDAGCTQAVGGVPTEIGAYFVRAEVDSDGNVDGAVSTAVKVQIVKKYAAADKPEGATFFARLLNDARLVTAEADKEKYATGADLVLNAGKREQIFVFTNVADAATFTTKGRGTADILVIAGGGAGGYNAGAGGGAGGAVYSTDISLKGAYTIQVGKGGMTATSSEDHSTNGENSSISNATEAVVDVAIGGGAGGGYSSSTKADVKTAICTGYVGGSGGGGYKDYAGGAGTAGQGNAGYGSDSAIQGGGGGAGEAATSNNGGAGRTFYLLGYAEAFAGGGGAGCDKSTSQAIGGLGGGGAGGYWNRNDVVTAISGEDGLGAGGGGGGGGVNATDANKLAGKGGDGIVIIRYTAEPSGVVIMFY